MKNLLFTAAFILVTLLAPAQNYKEHKTPYGNNCVVKMKDGKYITSHFISVPGTLAQSHINFASSGLLNETGVSSAERPLENERDLFHLIIHFDKAMNGGGAAIDITSNSDYFSIWDMMISEDGLTVEKDLPANNYEILAMYDMAFVSVHDICVFKDTIITINFEDMAVNKISLECMDENGNLLNLINSLKSEYNFRIHKMLTFEA